MSVGVGTGNVERRRLAGGDDVPAPLTERRIERVARDDQGRRVILDRGRVDVEPDLAVEREMQNVGRLIRLRLEVARDRAGKRIRSVEKRIQTDETDADTAVERVLRSTQASGNADGT